VLAGFDRTARVYGHASELQVGTGILMFEMAGLQRTYRLTSASDSRDAYANALRNEVPIVLDEADRRLVEILCADNTAWRGRGRSHGRRLQAARHHQPVRRPGRRLRPGDRRLLPRPYRRAIPVEPHAGKEIHVVLDNLSTHTTPEVNAWLAANPNVTFHFTPVGSSWLNQIEIWFGLITRQSIRRGTFTSVNVLIAGIRDYVAHWNRDAEPFTWTATADQILAKVRWVQTSIKQLVENNTK
jgi:hypothetical protein